MISNFGDIFNLQKGVKCKNARSTKIRFLRKISKIRAFSTQESIQVLAQCDLCHLKVQDIRTACWEKLDQS